NRVRTNARTLDSLPLILWALCELVTRFRKRVPAGDNIVRAEHNSYSERWFRVERRAIWTKRGLKVLQKSDKGLKGHERLTQWTSSCSAGSVVTGTRYTTMRRLQSRHVSAES